MSGATDASGRPATDKALRRDRLVIIASLTGLTALAWLYLWQDAARMDAMPAMDTMTGMTGMTSPWSTGQVLLTFAMWSIMMVGMMAPSAAPAVLMYARLAQRDRPSTGVIAATWRFVAGYFLVWTVFSLAASLAQTGLEQARLMTPMLASTSPWLTGGLLIVAGVYQWLPVKSACLQACRTPMQFFMFHWRPGSFGAVHMGIQHGLMCLGCCWVLMLLLFTAGVMNLLWVAVIACAVLVEKIFPAGQMIGRGMGVALVVAGTIVLLQAA